MLFAMVGRPLSAAGLLANQFPEVTIKETKEKLLTTTPDVLVATGHFADAGVLSVHIEGGKRITRR